MSRVVGWCLGIAATLMVFARPPLAQVIALAAAVAAALVLDPRVLRAVLRLGVVLMAVFSSAAAGAVVVWSSDWASGLEAATAMLLRLLVLLILAALLARNVNAEALLGGARRLGLERLGLILGLAMNVLPHLAEAARQVVMAWRVRRRSRAARPPTPMQLVEVLLAHVARLADEAAAAAALRGHGALQQRPVGVAPTSRLVVVTGAPGSGKTTAVVAAAEALRGAGCRVVGFVQPATFSDGGKVGFRIRDLVTGDEAELARRVDRAAGQHGTAFQFSAAGFKFARRALKRAGSGDVLVVDELGPLELRDRGHMPAVRQALRTSGLKAVAVVVRRHLVPSLLAALQADDAVIVDVTDPNGSRALVEELERAAGSGPAVAADPVTADRRGSLAAGSVSGRGGPRGAPPGC